MPNKNKQSERQTQTPLNKEIQIPNGIIEFQNEEIFPLRLKDLKAIPLSDKVNKEKIWWLYLDKIISIYPVTNINKTGVASYMVQMVGGTSYEIRDEADKSIIAEILAEYEKDFNTFIENKKEKANGTT